MEEPTFEQVRDVGVAMIHAGFEKARELRCECDVLVFAEAVKGIAESLAGAIQLFDILGPEGVAAILEMAENSEKYKMMKEAEEAINGSK